VPSALPTEGIDAGLLPTVQTQGLKQCKKDKTVFMPLGLLPTPRGSDGQRGPAKLTDGMSVRKSGKAFSAQLTDLSAAGLLPTPTAIDAANSSLPASQVERKSGLPRMAMNGMLPTPITGDYRSGMSNRYGTNHTQQLNDTIAFQTGTASQLNPLFVAEMMGFPVNWTTSPFQSGETDQSKLTATP
jgi:hypothetical protein